MSNFENTKYMILDYSEIYSVDLNQIIQKNIQELRLSLDGTKTVVKWEGTTPSSVDALSSKQGPYTHDDILTIMKGGDWTEKEIPIRPR